ncbi:MAG: hypothetical protein LWX09_12815 [Bacteroidia bacterium]|jgi:hypothetical protein|nr:hypothetical protein [Bacteroidia bacterium]
MARKRKTKKKKFREVKIKLTARQYESISNYAKGRNLSLNKLVRRSIKPYLTGYEKVAPVIPKVTANQLNIFQMIDSVADKATGQV